MKPMNKKLKLVLFLIFSISFLLLTVEIYVYGPNFFSSPKKNIASIKDNMLAIAAFEKYIFEADRYAETNEPDKALHAYELALNQVKDDPKRSVKAKFGIADMQLWLENYEISASIYRELYNIDLKERDHELALEGLIKSLTYDGRPKEAISLIPLNFNYRKPGLVIAVAEAYLAAEDVNQAVAFIKAKEQLLQEIPKDSHLLKELDKLKKQIDVAMYNMMQTQQVVHLTKKQKLFAEYLNKAKAAFMAENFKEAICFYTLAQRNASSQSDTNTTLFGLGGIYISMGENYKALNIYKALLEEKLQKEDFEVALNGYVNSLSNLDKPMMAYYAIPENFKYTNPRLIVTAAQAALWAGWPYKSSNILSANENLLQQIDPNSRLGGLYEEVLWQTTSLTAPNTADYKHYYLVDSEKFRVFRGIINYSHRTSAMFNTSLALTRNHFTIPGLWPVNGNVVTLQEDGLLNDYFGYLANLSSANYQYWNPILWDFKLALQPNDTLTISARNNKEIVEAIPAINNHITLDTSEFNIRIEPIYRVFISGAFFNSKFSDNYKRNGSSANFSYLLLSDYGVYIDYFIRSYHAKNPSQFYFSPLKFRQTLLSLRIKHHITNTWNYYASGGVGRQWINTDPYTIARKLQFGITGPLFKCINLDGYYLYSSSADNSVTGAYSYKVIGANLQFIF